MTTDKPTPTPTDYERARKAWYEHGLNIPTAHPPSDSGAPEEWPTLFEAFTRALAAVRQQAEPEPRESPEAAWRRAAERCEGGLPETEQYDYGDFDPVAWVAGRKWERENPDGSPLDRLRAFLDDPTDPPDVSREDLIAHLPRMCFEAYRSALSDHAIHCRTIASRYEPPPEGEAGSGWVSVEERLPEPGVPVLIFVNGRRSDGSPFTRRLRGTYSDGKSLEPSEEMYGDEWCVYDEERDEYFCPKGWFEQNEYEDTHWQISDPVTHWRPLPAPPEEA